ncbi:MAG: pyridoxamine 5'-phosphate oxidase family protein [Deltaproteobacteria bacterium]|nr:pyridoxamine 5'-phosphate oxidase family protein [Deltaproteobacteria bacterium]
MGKLNERMKEIFNNQEVIALSTCSGEGVPNVVPMSAKKILDDDTILLSDQFFGKTLKNLKENPKASVATWDGLEGYQIKGSVTIETSGPVFEKTVQWIDEMGKKHGLPLKCKGAVILKIEEIFNVSPGPEAGIKVA